MISAWWLLLIVPVAASAGVLIAGLLAAGRSNLTEEDDL